MDYPYANGTIKSLETKIQDRNKLFVLNKYDKNEFVKVLQAMNYGLEGNSIETLIEEENQKVKNILNEITPNQQDTDLFYLVNDAQNLKVLYKIKKYHLNKESLLNNSGTMQIETLQKAVLENNDDGLNKHIKALIKTLNKKEELIQNPKLLSSMIDNEMYHYALNATNNKILIKYLKAKIDFTNVISMIRAKNLGWNQTNYSEMFIDGGLINKTFMNELFIKTKEEQIKELRPYYNEKISNILQKSLSMNECQLEFDRLIIEIMAEDKDEPFNIGPIIYYYLLKQAEAQNIRILYSMKKAELKDLI